VTEPAKSAQTPSWVAPPESSGPNRVYLVGFLPLVFFIYLSLAAPAFMAPLYDGSVTIGGIPLGPIILVLAALLMLAGVLVMRAYPTAVGVVVGLVVFTLPSLFVVILGPAMMLITQDLGTT
jgi:hypothetical protein